MLHVVQVVCHDIKFAFSHPPSRYHHRPLKKHFGRPLINMIWQIHPLRLIWGHNKSLNRDQNTSEMSFMCLLSELQTYMCVWSAAGTRAASLSADRILEGARTACRTWPRLRSGIWVKREQEGEKKDRRCQTEVRSSRRLLSHCSAVVASYSRWK